MSLGTQSARLNYITLNHIDIMVVFSSQTVFLIFFFYSLKHVHCHTALYITQYRGRTNKKVKKQITGGGVEAGCACTVKVFHVCSLGITLQHLFSEHHCERFFINTSYRKSLYILRTIKYLASHQNMASELRRGSIPLNFFSDCDAL